MNKTLDRMLVRMAQGYLERDHGHGKTRFVFAHDDVTAALSDDVKPLFPVRRAIPKGGQPLPDRLLDWYSQKLLAHIRQPQRLLTITGQLTRTIVRELRREDAELRDLERAEERQAREAEERERREMALQQFESFGPGDGFRLQ
jgi:hypothetical protein